MASKSSIFAYLVKVGLVSKCTVFRDAFREPYVEDVTWVLPPGRAAFHFGIVFFGANPECPLA